MLYETLKCTSGILNTIKIGKLICDVSLYDESRKANAQQVATRMQSAQGSIAGQGTKIAIWILVSGFFRKFYEICTAPMRVRVILVST